MATAMILPWGARSQAVSAIVAALAVFASQHMVKPAADANSFYLAAGSFAIFLGSIHLATELDLNRRQRSASERASKTNEERLVRTIDATSQGIWDWQVESSDVRI